MADEPAPKSVNLPSPAPEKPSFVEWLESFLPFTLPRIALPQTAKNLDKALARVVDAGGDYYASSIDQTRRLQDARTGASIDLIKRGTREVAKRLAAGDEALADRSIEAAIGEQVRSQRNREAIVGEAIKELEHDPPTTDAPGEIDDDWLNLFASLAARKSNQDIQSLWGKLLAGEIRKPGSFKLRTLQSLSVLDATDAELIHKHMGFVIDGHQLIYGHGHNLVSYRTMLQLQALDVLHEIGGLSVVRSRLSTEEPLALRLGTKQVLQIFSDKEADATIREGSPMTPFGRELYYLAAPEVASPGVAEELVNQFGQPGRKILLLDLGPVRSDGGYPILAQTELYNSPAKSTQD